MPPTLGGAEPHANPAVREWDREWVEEALPQYMPDGAAHLKYLGPSEAGLASAVVVRGPHTDLPDVAGIAARVPRVTVGQVQCARTGGGTEYEDAIEGYTCWRTSGTFSVSVLTLRADVPEAAALVNELWNSQ